MGLGHEKAEAVLGFLDVSRGDIGEAVPGVGFIACVQKDRIKVRGHHGGGSAGRRSLSPVGAAGRTGVRRRRRIPWLGRLLALGPGGGARGLDGGSLRGLARGSGRRLADDPGVFPAGDGGGCDNAECRMQNAECQIGMFHGNNSTKTLVSLQTSGEPPETQGLATANRRFEARLPSPISYLLSGLGSGVAAGHSRTQTSISESPRFCQRAKGIAVKERFFTVGLAAE